MAVSIRVILYPMELRIRLVTVVLNAMPTTTTRTIVYAVVIVTSVTVTRVIIPATMTPPVTAYTVHVIPMLGIVTSFTVEHTATTWLTVARVIIVTVNICSILITV
jgi:hypothetical protein